MANYYEETVEKIKELLQANELDEALALVTHELAMPYIPSEYLGEFEALAQEIKSMRKTDTTQSLMTIDDIELALHKGDILVIESLRQLYLKPHLDRINQWLQGDIDRALKSLIILVLVEQSIGESCVIKDELEVHFVPAMLEHPLESEGFTVAKALIDEVHFQDPTTNELCTDLLIQQLIYHLPLSYDGQEGRMLGFGVIRAVDQMSGQDDVWQKRVQQYNIDESYLLEIKSIH